MTIALNADGEVIEILNPWSYFEADQEYPLMSNSDALERLKNLDYRNATVQGLELTIRLQ